MNLILINNALREIVAICRFLMIELQDNYKLVWSFRAMSFQNYTRRILLDALLTEALFFGTIPSILERGS